MIEGRPTVPDRQLFYEDMANVLGRGYRLMRSDLAEIGQHYGYTEATSSVIFDAEGTKRFERASRELSSLGVELTVDMYRNRAVYYDKGAVPDVDDKLATESRIDAILTASTQKNRASREQNIREPLRVHFTS